ncbi:exonuclease [Duganella sp. FT109W]|uniref:Exonuclease n=1 Tax=Duganella margarita TaxID=2692170 RepID=A0ABW9WN78_9BURK|nr:lambda exonuclease family protein [Duganella margarita]MYN42689.1 exonuclease [Duganella margarita]
MKFVTCAQGTPEWHTSRCGKITASRFADAISTVGGLDERQAKYVALVRGGMDKPDAAAKAGYKVLPSSDLVRRALLGEDTAVPSDIAKRYAADLTIERISGSPFGEPARAWVLERGHKMEELARMHYEARMEALVTEAGICLTDDEIFGYSTDGLVDDDGLIEVKAPIDSAKIIEMWVTGDVSEYMHQMQGGMWITGRKWCDFLMYAPDLAAINKDLYIKRVMRDDAFIDDMVLRLAKFDAMVEANMRLLRYGPAPMPAPTPATAAPAAAPVADWRTAFLKTAV